jgi:methylmalonyl-CoA/ethylmalonyl-CoA epimerase
VGRIDETAPKPSACVTDLDHVGVKVADLSQAQQAIEALGGTCHGVKTYDEVGMRIAFLSIGGLSLELLEPVSDASPIRGDAPGVHHLALATPDIEASHRRLSADDRYEVAGPIRQGAHSRIFFFRIKQCAGLLFECTEAR